MKHGNRAPGRNQKITHDPLDVKPKGKKKPYIELEGSKGVVNPTLLDSEQRKGYGIIDAKALTVLTGDAGTGKTLLAVYYALDKLVKGEIEKIIITRPTFSEHTIGFLPGGISDKYLLYVAPMISNMYRCLHKTKVDAYLRTGEIELIPQEFIRGITINNGVMIVDEVQNCNNKELKTIVTRIGVGGKLILCGDKSQIDLKDSKYSGLQRLIQFGETGDPDFGAYELQNNHRHPVVQRLVKFYESF